MRERERVAAADEHAERPIAAVVVVGRVGEAAAQEVDGGLELALGVLVGERGRDVLGRDAGGEQPLLDPLGAPRVDLAAVRREAPGVGRVVEVAPLAEDGDGLLDDLEVGPARDQVAADLGDGLVAAREPLPGEVERVLQRLAAEQRATVRRRAGLDVGVECVAYAACPPTAARAASASSSRSIGLTRSWVRPSAS